jgi:hypothetical protein
VNRPALEAFGLQLVTDIALPGQWAPPRNVPDRVLEIALDPSVPQVLAGATLEWAAPIDGGRLTLERGSDGAFLFRHESGRHLLSADARMLRCAPADKSDPAWFRVLLDSVLLCAALLGGREGLHAGSVVVGGGAAAIVTAPGGGKSTLVAELMRRGHQLVSDDITFLEPTAGGPPFALPGAPVMTLAEAEQAPCPGEVLMDLPGERWITVPVTNAAAPLLAIIQLDRRPGADTTIQPSGDAPLALLAALLALPKTRERALSRLDLASTLAAHCRILTLTADSLTAPAQLAELVEEALAAA